MSKNYKLVIYPDKVLTKKCEPVKLPLSEEDQELLDAMYNFVKDPENHAVGLAAPQFGVNKRMFVIRHKRLDGSMFNVKLVNPKIIKNTAKTYIVEDGESCLSEPGLTLKVERCKSITLIGYDAITKKNVYIPLNNYLAAVAQHEYDHLEGILLTTRKEGK